MMDAFFRFAYEPALWIHPKYKILCGSGAPEREVIDALWGKKSFSWFLEKRFALGWEGLETVLEGSLKPLILKEPAVLQKGCLRLGLSLQWRFFRGVISGEHLKKLKNSLGEETFMFVRTQAPLLGSGEGVFESRENSLALGTKAFLGVLKPLPVSVERRLGLKFPPVLGAARLPCGFAPKTVSVEPSRVERIFESL